MYTCVLFNIKDIYTELESHITAVKACELDALAARLSCWKRDSKNSNSIQGDILVWREYIRNSTIQV